MKNKREIFQALINGHILYVPETSFKFIMKKDGELYQFQDGKWIEASPCFSRPEKFKILEFENIFIIRNKKGN